MMTLLKKLVRQAPPKHPLEPVKYVLIKKSPRKKIKELDSIDPSDASIEALEYIGYEIQELEEPICSSFRRIDPKDYVHMLKEIQKALAPRGKYLSLVEQIIWAHTTYIGQDGTETHL